MTRILLALTFFSQIVLAQEPAQPAPEKVGTKRALIVCGLPGDSAHTQLYTGVVRTLHKALTEKLAFESGNIQIEFGGAWSEKDSVHKPGPGTRESLGARATALKQALKPDDALWVIVIGHANHDGRLAWLNLPGPDLSHAEFAKLFVGMTCREQVFFITTPVSGYFLKSLASPGRATISATEADQETNETLYPQALAEELSRLDPKSGDVDQDGKLTLFDLYVLVARNVAQRFLDEKNLATEHGQLDDNSDGKGSEPQLDYLTPDQGGRMEVSKPVPPRSATADGARSARIPLP